MKTFEEVLDEVTQEDTLVESVGTLIGGLRAQVFEALDGAELKPETLTKLESVWEKASSEKEKVADALLENTPEAG